MKNEVLISVKTLEPALFKELMDEQEALERAYGARDFEKVLLKTGKFVETFFQMLENLQGQKGVLQPDMKAIEERLAQLPHGTFPESVRIILPRLARATYAVRTKKGGGHRTSIPPQEIDAYICLAMTKYVVADLLSTYSNLPANDVAATVRTYLKPRLPLVEEFEDGQLMVLKDGISCKDKILLILYHLYPARIDMNVLRRHITDEPDNNIRASVSFSEKKKLVHKNENGLKLTDAGRRYVEETYSNVEG